MIQRKRRGKGGSFSSPVHCSNGTTPKIRPTPRNFPDSIPFRDPNTRKTPFISILITAQRCFQDATDQITPVKTPLAKKHSLLCCSFSLVDFITHNRDERRHFGMNGRPTRASHVKMKTIDAKIIRYLCRQTPMQCRLKKQRNAHSCLEASSCEADTQP